MNKKKLSFQNTNNDDIDLGEFLFNIWKEKIIILSIVTTFSFLGFVYFGFLKSEYVTVISIRNASSAMFSPYKTYLTEVYSPTQVVVPENKFNNEMRINLLSHDFITAFSKESKDFEEFRSHLQKEKINIDQYFIGRFKNIPEKEKENLGVSKYSLTFDEFLSGQKFLDDYVYFVKKKTTENFKKELLFLIKNEIDMTEQNLEIAKRISLKNPILQSMVKGNSVVNEPEALFYKGSEVLEQKLIHLNKLYKETKDLSLDYELVLQKASAPILVSKLGGRYTYSGFGALLGIFLSILILLFKSALLKKKIN